MRNNKAILDEAAHSVRRTFIGSVAGSVGMLAVVGAAGAYGMPEKLTAQAFTLALSKLKLATPAERPAPAAEPLVKLAENVGRRDVMPVAEPATPRREPVVRTMPELPAEPLSAPVLAQTPAAAPPQTVVASAPPLVPLLPVIEIAPVKAEPVPAPVPVIADAPAPVVTASIAPQALPAEPATPPAASAPLVFETPKLDSIPPLTELPKTEPEVPAVTLEPAKPAVQSAALEQTKATEPVKAAEPVALVWPPLVNVLPLPKPPLSPAQRLELHGKDYDKAEKCLAQAVYFEARNEPARGQQAVAQVVLNRVFSPYYPKDVCSVVFQNAHRHLSCQFTFACDGKPETIRERGAWARATRIAKQTLEAKVWLPEVNKATHYHAAYVHPRWVRDMRVMVRYGLHTFYRPRNWGDGSSEAHWGTASNSVKPAVQTVHAVHAVAAKHRAPPKRLALRRI